MKYICFCYSKSSKFDKNKESSVQLKFNTANAVINVNVIMTARPCCIWV